MDSTIGKNITNLRVSRVWRNKQPSLFAGEILSSVENGILVKVGR